ncbi:MAG: chemotaxis protein CheW [Deltaproteobacteria bacterium]|nr:chemotaxis protein CheW [Deltaproteobacteria bacterium]
MDLVVFKLGQRRFGFEVDEIREVLRLATITRIPLTPPTFLGAMHVRGQVLPVIDLARLVGEASHRPLAGASCLRVLRDTHHLLFQVGRVEEVVAFDDDEVAFDETLSRGDGGSDDPALRGLATRTILTARGAIPLLSVEEILARLSRELDELLRRLTPQEIDASDSGDASRSSTVERLF